MLNFFTKDIFQNVRRHAAGLGSVAYSGHYFLKCLTFILGLNYDGIGLIGDDIDFVRPGFWKITSFYVIERS